MKILLVCAAGLSTSILMKKLEKYAEQNGIELDIDAVGIGEYQETCANYDVLLLGPQVSYQLNTVKQGSGKPTASSPHRTTAWATPPTCWHSPSRCWVRRQPWRSS